MASGAAAAAENPAGIDPGRLTGKAATETWRLRNFPYKSLAYRSKIGLDTVNKKSGRNTLVAGGMA